MGQKYLRLESGMFTIVIAGVHEIKNDDIPIDNKDFEEYINTKEIEKFYRLKKVPTGKGLFDYVEEYAPEINQVDPVPSETEILKEKVNVLEKENADLLLDSALKDSKIETLQSDIADIMKEIAKGGQV
ncbi:hypothetical protein PMY38_09475 [Clostridium tertium]|uniref:hypothetical protein n=1 Tax=Clostridium tertium TaxID=1559 RepID=UPI00232CF154|nr:hypothetical protein [Clostridium tertium]MDB1956525.1 hypothetical protein [Clostridium tertium]MDB1958826.1 hypothetical protein [Clostridium tertium]MDB1962307.1 hypothetical protein [Clostridium tertium]MDB1967551.1 hypothetical protein [Clostridium tertium]